MISLFFFSWMPLVFNILVKLVLVVFLVWAITGIVKRVMDMIS